MGEKTALIVDPEGKDGAIKREEEQKGEREDGLEPNIRMFCGDKQTSGWSLVCMQMSLLDTCVCICIAVFNKHG